MTIRLDFRDQLSWRNNALPKDRTSDPWITNLLIELTMWTRAQVPVPSCGLNQTVNWYHEEHGCDPNIRHRSQTQADILPIRHWSTPLILFLYMRSFIHEYYVQILLKVQFFIVDVIINYMFAFSPG